MIGRVVRAVWRAIWWVLTSSNRMRCPRCAETSLEWGQDGSWRCSSCAARVKPWPQLGDALTTAILVVAPAR